ncbi:hypothetical protein [Aminobacter sp. AP02]|uniref:hypothetical protein n=1 Tax=Aminobacter sp. AP02 TaxID=2135737 RepID=UPI0018EE9284|nr:hypothetical protein [Aminobacter sp. AP02]
MRQPAIIERSIGGTPPKTGDGQQALSEIGLINGPIGHSRKITYYLLGCDQILGTRIVPLEVEFDLRAAALAAKGGAGSVRTKAGRRPQSTGMTVATAAAHKGGGNVFILRR